MRLTMQQIYDVHIMRKRNARRNSRVWMFLMGSCGVMSVIFGVMISSESASAGMAMIFLVAPIFGGFAWLCDFQGKKDEKELLSQLLRDRSSIDGWWITGVKVSVGAGPISLPMGQTFQINLKSVRGDHDIVQITREGLPEAIDLFRSAIGKEPWDKAQ